MNFLLLFSQVKCEEPFYLPPLQSPFLNSSFNSYEDSESEPEVIHINNLYIRDLVFNGTEVILDEPEQNFFDDDIE